MSDRLGVVIFGCGYWGMNYVRLFNELAETRVIAVCDLKPERLNEVSRRFPSASLLSDPEEAFQLDGFDIAIVCTNAVAHYGVVKRCLEEGKHVLVEKPMATSTERSEKLLALAEAQGVVLMVGHIFLYNGGIQKVRSYIERGELGEIYYLYARRTNLGPIRHDVNVIWDLATHDVSIFNHLLGQRPLWVSAVGSRVLHNSREDVGFIVLGYPNNALGHIHVSWAEPNKVREIVVVGSDKRIVFNDLDPLEQVRIFEKGIAPSEDHSEPSSYGEYHFSIRDGDIISPKTEISEPLKNECRHFLECVLKGQAPLSDGRNGLEVVQIIEATNRSILANGAPVELKWETDAEKPLEKEKKHEYAMPTSPVH
jgi:predicted dehydrogenase